MPAYVAGANPSLLLRDFVEPEAGAMHPVIREPLRARPTGERRAASASFQRDFR